jgi:excisionase family DNA binding protein
VIDIEALRALIREVVRQELDHRAPDRDHLTVAEYADRYSVSPTTVRAAIRDGRLPAIRIGRAVRVPVDAAIGMPRAVAAAEESPRAFADRVLNRSRGGGA